jgi:malonate transporter and related proteins
MTVDIVYKLLAIIFTVVLGYVAGRMQWLGRLNQEGRDGDPARVLGNVAFFIFVPALLFRTTARLDLAHMPWRTMLAFFVPVLVVMFGVYFWQRRAAPPASGAPSAAAPSTRAISASFGNSVQLGIPLAAALFGEAGLAIHVALVSLHALVLLSVLTALVEMDLVRARARHEAAPPLWATLRTTIRNTIIHPVVLPVLAGLLWNLTGLGLHGVVDESLATLAAAVVPVCLVLIGVTLAAYGLQGSLRGALAISAIKLLVLPAMVLLMARWVFGLEGLPLAVVVIMASLPVGSNALIFAQRYETLQAEATAAIVVSTAAFAGTVSLWLAVLAGLG